MKRKGTIKLAMKRRAEQERTPQVPTNLHTILQRLNIISEWYESTRDKENQNQIDMLIARIKNQQSKINGYTSTFRGIGPSRIEGYSSAVQKLIALCRKAEEIPYPVGFQIESAKALLKAKIQEAIANGDLPERSQAVIRLQDRIAMLEHAAGQ